MNKSAALHPYARPEYVGSLGPSMAVPEWNCPVLLRPIPGQTLQDAIGPYPMAPLGCDVDLAGGLERLQRAGLVSVVLVPDPLGGLGQDQLAAHFSLCRPFKTHYLIDRTRGPAAWSKNHRLKINKARRLTQISRGPLLPDLGAWARLYGQLVDRHGISGMQNFSPRYFEVLSGLDGLEAFVAKREGQIVAMSLWFAHDGIAYYHLGASSGAGYAVSASYGLHAAAIEHFQDCAVINLGGGAGNIDDPSDGLARFKRGFSNAQVVALLCGAILDAGQYQWLSTNAPPSEFFPLYRSPRGEG